MTRPEIQALRALAVVSVVIYHAWPHALPGGYAGVDVFFAISGFLITAHLLREVQRSGRVSLPAFWARRARRLLPASLLTLLACTILTLLFVPRLYWQQFLTETVASGAYVQNWQLASDAVDYLAAQQRDSPVRHFWSLSAEEQFYVLWPLLIGGAALLVRARRRAAIVGVLVAVTGASFVWSVLQTASDPAAAYFITPTRAWEFGAGGLLALAAGGGRRLTRLRPTERGRRVLSWTGLGAIAATMGLYGAGTPFPGVAAALPVLGTLAVIAAGAPGGRWSPLRLMRPRPVQAVGDISYAVYLWHWPLLVLAPFVIGGDGVLVAPAMVVLTVVLAALTTRTVENPIRTATWLGARRPRVTFAAAGVATALLVALVVGARSDVDGEIDDARLASAQVLANHPPCFGARARDPDKRCENPSLREVVVPAPIEARTEDNASCSTTTRTGLISACSFGAREGRERGTVALLGDSHAVHWRAALQVVARAQRWRGLSVTRTSCPFTQAERVIDEPGRSRCRGWNDALPRWFARHPEVHTVFVSANTGGEVDRRRGETMLEAETRGYERAWASLPDTVRNIVVLRDTPKVRFATLDCIEQAQSDERRPGSACAVPRVRALRPDPAAMLAQRPGTPRAQAIDLTDVLCTRAVCPPVIGGALVYKDQDHMTPEFARTLGGQVLRRLRKLGVTSAS